MDLIMPQVFDRIKAASGELVRCRRYDIGPWNMDTTTSVYIYWTWPDVTKIRSVDAMILADSGVSIYPLCGVSDASTGKCKGGIYSISTGNICLFRTDGNIFDGTAFDDPSMNRGWVFVWYVE